MALSRMSTRKEQPILAFTKAALIKYSHYDRQMAAGRFAHGVMNTDNLNITGSTLDFGPYGFMERFRLELD